MGHNFWLSREWTHSGIYVEMVTLLKIKIQVKLMILVYHVKGLGEKIALVDLYYRSYSDGW